MFLRGLLHAPPTRPGLVPAFRGEDGGSRQSAAAPCTWCIRLQVGENATPFPFRSCLGP